MSYNQIEIIIHVHVGHHFEKGNFLVEALIACTEKLV